jgi:mitofusin
VPQFMAVGSGSTSESATALMTSLNEDSGYGSVAGENIVGGERASWQAGLMEDRPTPIHTPTTNGEMNAAGSYS